MIYLRENPIGIDEEINRLQKYLYDRIIEKWGLQDFEAYGRVYKNKRNSLTIPEYYISKREYKEVLLDDRLSGIMFFSAKDKTEVSGNLLIQECDIIFTFNIESLEGSNQREDEKVKHFILSELKNYNSNVHFFNKIETGLNNVYQDYNGVSKYFRDMQEFHHFKTTVKLKYNINKCI